MSSYDQAAMIENAHFPTEGHDYGPSKRAALYPFFAKHLKLDLSRVTDASGKVDESFFEPLEESALRVFDDAHPRPQNEEQNVRVILQALHAR